jgi:hypothetical protein
MTETEYEDYDELLEQLRNAEQALSRALDLLYKPGGIHRGLGYRARVARAQSIAMTLFVREVNHKEGKISGGVHEWEVVGHEWECVFCEKRVKPKMVGPRLVFWPDVARRVPLYGRKWRCSG